MNHDKTHRSPLSHSSLLATRLLNNNTRGLILHYSTQTMTSSTTSWLKVAQGFKLVAQAASKIAIEEGSTVATQASRHSMELARNARNATAHVANAIELNSIRSIVSDNRNVMSHEMKNNAVSVGGINGGHQQKHLQDGKFAGQVHEAESKKNEGEDDALKRNTNNIALGSDSHEPVGSQLAQINEESSEKSNVGPLHIETELQQTNNMDIREASIFDSNEYNQSMNQQQKLKEGQAVPSTRIGRAMGFASLGVGLAAGTAVEFASRVVSRVTNSSTTHKGSIVTNDANSDRLAKTLCRMRGAALKLGQMLSIQDETLLAPPLAKALEQVRHGADAMPLYQLQAELENELGQDWRKKFVHFDEMPFAAASIGQVHRATVTTKNGSDEEEQERQVVVKCQYPGVADSIESDLNNLSMIVKMTGLTPPGLFIDNVIRVGREELIVECNYLLEAQNQERFRQLVHSDEKLSKERFRVPAVINDLTTKQVITTEYCPGGTIDKVAFLDQEERNRIGRNIIRLTIKELFVWRFMQTDPNWGNFLYDVGTGTTYLIDFGSAREYSKSFVDGYLRIVWANANQDAKTLMDLSRKMGFLTGEENDIMLNAHKMSGFTVGEPFATYDEYDFAASGVTGRLSDHGSAFLQHRLTPPPEEVYTLHRKLAGAYNLCIKLGAKIKCRDLLEEVLKDHVFEDGLDHPLH